MSPIVRPEVWYQLFWGAMVVLHAIVEGAVLGAIVVYALRRRGR